MKIRKVLMIMLLVLAFVPNVIFAAAKDCSSYSVDKCPANNCLIENGACVKGHIGQNFCSQDQIIDVMRVVGYFLLIIRVAVPFAVIFFGTLDMYKAVQGGDEKSLASSAKKLGIRFLIGFSVFLIPSILHIILSTLNDYEAISDDANICQTCLLKPTECEDGLPSDTNPFDDELFDTTEPEFEEDEEEDDIVVE